MAEPPIWTEPLELVCDGTPVVAGRTFDDGDRELFREDGLLFTVEQHPRHIQRCLRVTFEGKHWGNSGPTGPVLVRNRVQMDVGGDAAIDPRTGRPLGDHGTAQQAINFVLDEACEDLDYFLRAWRDGDLSQWPEYYEWLRDTEAQAALMTEWLRANEADAMMAERDKGGVA